MNSLNAGVRINLACSRIGSDRNSFDCGYPPATSSSSIDLAMSLPIFTPSDSRRLEMNRTLPLFTGAAAFNKGQEMNRTLPLFTGAAAVNKGQGFLTHPATDFYSEFPWLKMGSLRPCYLRRVEEAIRTGQDYSFSPKVLSVGPLHHGKKDLKEVEDLKDQILEEFAKGMAAYVTDVLIFIKEKVFFSYPEYIQEEYGSNLDYFWNMCFKDACVALYIIDIVANRKPSSVFGRATLEHCITDVLLLENQLPSPLLNLLNTVKFGKKKGEQNVVKFLYAAMNRRLSDSLPQLPDDLFYNAPHLVALLRQLCLLNYCSPSNYTLFQYSVEELDREGVKIVGIEPKETEGLLGGGFEFSKSTGTLRTTTFNIYDTDRFKKSFLNVMAFESIPSVNSTDETITKFIHVNAALLRDPGSVAIGREKYVSTRYSNETIAALFKDMTLNSFLNFEVYENAQDAPFGLKCKLRKWRKDFYEACLKSPRLIVMTLGACIVAYGAWTVAYVQLIRKLD